MDKTVKVLKKVKIINLIILTIILSVTSYAWMLNASNISTIITANISAWNFEFSLENDDNTTTDITVNIGQIYPGMDDYIQKINAKNNGDIDGEVTYEIKSVRILNTRYEVSSELTSEDLINKLKNDYPFKMSLSSEEGEKAEILAGQSSILNLAFSWSLDSGDDELDTRIGEDAYAFYQANPDTPAIQIELTLKAVQKL